MWVVSGGHGKAGRQPSSTHRSQLAKYDHGALVGGVGQLGVALAGVPAQSHTNHHCAERLQNCR
jgi:hypothetical protein